MTTAFEVIHAAKATLQSIAERTSPLADLPGELWEGDDGLETLLGQLKVQTGRARRELKPFVADPEPATRGRAAEVV